MRKVKLKLQYQEFEIISGILLSIKTHRIGRRNIKLSDQIIYAASEELHKVMQKKRLSYGLAQAAEKQKTLTLSYLHAILLKGILQYFGKNGTAVEDAISSLILLKLDPQL